MGDRRYPTQPVVAVGAVIVRGDRVLLARRGKEPASGLWTFPGGGLELGETVREGARREVKEECDLDVELGEMLGVFDRVRRDDDGRVLYHYVIVDFAARSVRGEPVAGDDCAEVKWVQVDEIEEPLLRDLARQAIASFRTSVAGVTGS
ncbi:MAG: NUDIX hydrolase [Chloroflexi bacterium]|nr:NUDIX hydrolase [Chloroflexota bacterium]